MKNDPEIRYRHSLVAFIDILGFKQLVNNQREELRKIRNNLTFLRKVAGVTTNSVSENDYAKMFSDNITLSLPVQKGALYSFLKQVVYLQGELANRGVFLRGAVVVGEHFEDEKVLFGPALVEAVELERSVALWPRVVVHPGVRRLMTESGLWAIENQSDSKYVTSLLRRGPDGISYVNYLRIFPDECDSAEDGVNFLKNHRKWIEQEANKNKMNLSVLAKYYWLATYHNLEMNKRKRSDLQIDKRALFRNSALGT